MEKLGLGKHVEPGSRCPFRPNDHLSFSVWQDQSGGWNWKCDECRGFGGEVEFLCSLYGIRPPEALQRYVTIAGVETSPQRKEADAGSVQSANGATNGNGAQLSNAAAVKPRALGELLDAICGF